MRNGLRGIVAICVLALTFTGALAGTAAAVPNPVATDDATYMLFGRAFPDPQGCGVNPVGDPIPVSPWAKGNVCTEQFLGYDEVIAGAEFLQSRHSRFLQVIRLDQAYDNPDYRSAGLPTAVGVDEDGNPKVLTRDRRPLYLFKITDSQSSIPERERHHFVYSLSIHGIERAGLEGGIRAMEDLVTWAACEADASAAPACAEEGPFPKQIVETPTEKPSPTAGHTLKNSVIYFMPPNPDGWKRGEVGEGGAFFQRYNGNGVDLNRDWPTVGFSYRPFSPGSEPETKAYGEVLRRIARQTSRGRFTGGIDLHGQLVATAYSFTLLGAGQRDFRRNFSTVDQSLRAWQDQSQRLSWSPYVLDDDADGFRDDGDSCAGGNFCVADQWGTVVDTLGYQITGGVGDWFESDSLGLGAVGIDNEMSLSHLVPNIGYEPINEQMHVDGNKGLIYSQLASMLTESDDDYVFDPAGRIGYVLNRKRISSDGESRPSNPDLPAQNTIDTTVPCPTGCDGATYGMDGNFPTLEFDVLGPDRGVFNGGLSVTATFANVQGISPSAATTRIALDVFDEGQWQQVSQSLVSEATYATAGQIVTTNDPKPGRWRVRMENLAPLPARIEIDFRKAEGEASPGQAPFSASAMDFFDELNRYVRDPDEHAKPVTVEQVISDPRSLRAYDSLVVVDEALPAYADAAGTPLDLTDEERSRYFANLKAYAEGGGNLVLTDRALGATETLGLVPAGAVGSNQPSGRGAVPRIQFSLGGSRGNLCTPDTTDPLAKDVCLPGSAGGTQRQVAEPTPLGYAPDTGMNNTPSNKMTQFYVNRAAWETDCGAACTSGLFNNQTGLGERKLGLGTVRIVGSLLPEPNFESAPSHDQRFGVASYALTYGGWQVFLNLVDYQRPAPETDLSVTLAQTPDPVLVSQPVNWTAQVANAGPDDAHGVEVAFALPVAPSSLPEDCTGTGTAVTCTLGSIAAGESRQVSLSATPWEPGALSAEAVVTSAVTDTDASNDRATASGSATCTVTGTPGRDSLRGTDAADVLCGLGGDDTIRAMGGDDVLVGGAGADDLDGGTGTDTCRRDAADRKVKSCER